MFFIACLLVLSVCVDDKGSRYFLVGFIAWLLVYNQVSPILEVYRISIFLSTAIPCGVLSIIAYVMFTGWFKWVLSLSWACLVIINIFYEQYEGYYFLQYYADTTEVFLWGLINLMAVKLVGWKPHTTFFSTQALFYLTLPYSL